MDELDKLRETILDSETFCFYPFLEVSTRPNGAVFPCCYWNDLNDRGFKDEQRISDDNTIRTFWNNDLVQRVRTDIASEKKVGGCSTCYRDGKSSMRQRSIKEYSNDRDKLQLVKDTLDNNSIATHTPIKLELKPSNLCNLKCLICNSYDSSQIEKEFTALSKDSGIETKGGSFFRKIDKPGIWEAGFPLEQVSKADWAESAKFWEEVEMFLPKIEVLSFAGGEPTLNPVVHKIIEYCVTNDYAKNIKVFVSSNFTNLNAKFLKSMSHFKQFELIASIDAVGEVQEYSRFPSNWKQIQKNFEEAKQYMKHDNIKILVNATVSIFNIFEIHKLLWYIDEQSKLYPYYKEWPFNINLLAYPPHQEITIIPEKFRKPIINELQNYIDNSTMIKQFPELQIKIDLLINQLLTPCNNNDSIEKLNLLRDSLDVLDKHRGVSYKVSIPQLDQIFKDTLV